MLFKLKVMTLSKSFFKAIGYFTAVFILFILSFILLEPIRIALVSSIAHQSVQSIDKSLTISRLTMLPFRLEKRVN